MSILLVSVDELCTVAVLLTLAEKGVMPCLPNHGHVTQQQRGFPQWYESDDRFPKLHPSAKLSKLSRSVCTHGNVTAERVALPVERM